MTAGPPLPDLPCQELVELCTAYLEEALPPDVRARFDAHLAICDGCRTYLEQLRHVIRAAGALSEEDLDPGVRDRLLAAFRGWKG